MSDDQKPFPWQQLQRPHDGQPRRVFQSPSNNLEFITYDGWLVHKELGQGAYGIVW
jgi:hypothetical protein